MSVLAQCMNPMVHSRRRGHCPDHAKVCPPPPAVGTEAIIAHITRFCLGGIAAVRRQMLKGGSR